MPKASPGSKVIEGGKPKSVRRFGTKDIKHIEERVLDVLETRRRKRSDLELEWKDIDRQLAMKPEISHKRDPRTGQADPALAWMPEIELPLQSETLEVLTADARRLMLSNGGWFKARAALTDKYLRRVDFASLVAGDENDVPSLINQDNANKLAEGVVNHWHSQYDFGAHIDMINAEAFKYGAGVARGRMVKKSVFMKTDKGITKETQTIPILVPRSIKHTYLDDTEATLMNEGYSLGQSIIYTMKVNYNDFVVAASQGSEDPNSETGGWIKSQLKGIEPDKEGNVEIVEMEGDFSIPRKTTRGFFLPGIIVTVVKGGVDKGAMHKMVRLRFRQDSQNSYIEFPYHCEDMMSPYSTSPLRKGWPIQKAACEALMQVVISAWLNNLPPVAYDRNDTVFAADGGPLWFPGAQWATMGEVKVHNGLGDPSALFAIYTGFLQQYADVTGVNAPRLGAQTVSHTTAFAKEAELNRGTARTVDYAKAALEGPLTKWLDMEYRMGRKQFKRSTIYLPASGYEAYVELDKTHLPDDVFFDAIGAGGPSEEQQKQQNMLGSAQQSIQIDAMNIQLGGQPVLNLPELIKSTLRAGGWVDVDAITNGARESAPPAPQAGPGLAQPSGQDQEQAELAAIQAAGG